MSEIKKIATRESYGNALVEVGKEHEDLIVLDADLAGATKTGIFKKAFPERHWDVGIAEANMTGIAAGLATCGKVPFISSFAMFAAAVFYPEYCESYDEIAPAHIFGRSIEGEGFRARQCFKEGVPDLSQYDTIFPKACAEEKENTLLHILSLRLRYPVSLTDEAKERYVAHLREQELYIIPKLVGQKNMERITFFCENGWITQAAVKAGLEQASRMEWAEGTAELLHLQRKYFTEQKKERYSFDELW